MPIVCKANYSVHSVSKILKDSENASSGAGDRGQGHSEGLHELQSAGRGRAATSLAEIEERIVGDEKKTKSGAFDGCQADAIAFALNSKAGQTALGLLATKDMKHIFVKIDISGGGFYAVNMDKDEVNAVAGVDFVVAPSGVTLGGFLKNNRAVAGGVAMKLMKNAEGNLHIRTAFPLAAAPNPGTCQCTASGWTNTQLLPV